MAFPINAATMARTRKRDRRVHRANNNNSSSRINNGLALSLPLLTSLLAEQAAGAAAPTYSRASTAYGQDHEGVMRQVQSGEARFWGARRVRNLLTFTEAFSNAAWTKANIANSAYNQASFDGRLVAVKLVTDNGSSVVGNDDIGSIWQTAASGPAIGSTVVVSVYAKAGESQVLRIRESISTGRRAVFDLAAGTISYENGATASNYPADMQSLGNGWWRCYVAYATSSATVKFSFKASGSGTSTTGDGASGLYVALPQVEDITGASVFTPNEYVSANVLSAPYQGTGVDGVQCHRTVRLHTQNFLQYSEDFSQSYWTASFSNVTSTQSGATTPEGTRAWTFVTDNVNIAHRIGKLHTVPAVRGKTYEVEVTIRAGTRNQCALRIVDSAFVEGTRINVTDLAAMTNFKLDSGTPAASSVSIEDLGNGWRRLVVRCTFSQAAAETGTVYWLLYGEGTIAAYQGDGSEELYFARPACRIVAASVVPSYFTTGANADTGTDTGSSAMIPASTLLGYFADTAGTQLVTPTASIRDLTDASWTKTTMTTAKTSIGITGVANSATRCTATAANATALQPAPVTAAGAYTASFYIRRVTGTGNIDITVDGGTTWSTISGSINRATYTRVQVTATLALNTARIGLRIATNGDVVDVDFAQLESGLGATSPMDTAGASVRAADQLSYPVALWTSALQANGTAYADATPFVDVTGGAGYIFIIEAATNGAMLFIGSGNGLQSTDATTFPGVSGGALVPGTTYKSLVRWGTDPDLTARYRVYASGRTKSADTAFDGSMGTPAVTAFRVGANSGGGGALRGCVRNIRLYNAKLTDVQADVQVA